MLTTSNPSKAAPALARGAMGLRLHVGPNAFGNAVGQSFADQIGKTSGGTGTAKAVAANESSLGASSGGSSGNGDGSVPAGTVKARQLGQTSINSDRSGLPGSPIGTSDSNVLYFRGPSGSDEFDYDGNRITGGATPDIELAAGDSPHEFLQRLHGMYGNDMNMGPRNVGEESYVSNWSSGSFSGGESAESQQVPDANDTQSAASGSTTPAGTNTPAPNSVQSVVVLGQKPAWSWQHDLLLQDPAFWANQWNRTYDDLLAHTKSNSAGSDLKVSRGQITFDAEGNDNPKSRYFSRRLQWPGGDSGVTLGRGYDMKLLSQNSVKNDLMNAGLERDKAEDFSKGAKLTGDDAKSFVLDNGEDLGEISRTEQKKLFEIAYSRKETYAQSVYERLTKNNSTAAKWDDLSSSIKDVAVDTIYQGLPKSVRSDFINSLSQNDPKQLIDFFSTNEANATYTKVRNQVRIDYLNSKSH